MLGFSRQIDTKTLARYALTAGLSRFAPLPFVDGAITSWARRSMLERIAYFHALGLTERELIELCDPSTKGARAVVRDGAVAMFKAPVRWVARRAAVAFTIKDVVDLTAKTFVFGLAFDVALDERWLERYGSKSLGVAIEKATETVARSPVEAGLVRVFNNALGGVKALLGARTGVSETVVAEVSEVVSAGVGDWPALRGALRRTLGDALEIEARERQ